MSAESYIWTGYFLFFYLPDPNNYAIVQSIEEQMSVTGKAGKIEGNALGRFHILPFLCDMHFVWSYFFALLPLALHIYSGFR